MEANGNELGIERIEKFRREIELLPILFRYLVPRT